MPSPFNIRYRLGHLFKAKNPVDTAGRNEVLDAFSQELTKALHILAGGREECQKIFAWMKQNPHVNEVALHASKKTEISFLIQETSFANVIRRYEKELGLSPRVLGNPEIQNVIDFGRHIRAVRRSHDTDIIHFAYTMGNSTLTIPMPELLCFYPSANTCNYVLSHLSQLLIDGVIKPPTSSKIREVRGVLGSFGQIPVRMRLLDGDILEYSHNNWTTGIPRSDRYPLVLVDIPDIEGYFPCEEECQEIVKQGYPRELLRSVVDAVEIINNVDTSEFDNYLFAHRCIGYFRSLLDSDEEERMTDGSWQTLVNIEGWLNPESWGESNDDVAKDNMRMLRQCSYSKGLKEWVLERLDGTNDSSNISEEWSLPSHEAKDQLSECLFKSKADLLSQIQWTMITSVIIKTLEAISNKEQLNELIRLAETREQIINDSSDN